MPGITCRTPCHTVQGAGNRRQVGVTGDALEPGRIRVDGDRVVAGAGERLLSDIGQDRLLFFEHRFHLLLVGGNQRHLDGALASAVGSGHRYFQGLVIA